MRYAICESFEANRACWLVRESARFAGSQIEVGKVPDGFQQRLRFSGHGWPPKKPRFRPGRVKD